MNISYFILSCSLVFTTINLPAQYIQEELNQLLFQQKEISETKDSIDAEIKQLKLKLLIEKIHKRGLPELQENDELVCHSAMCLVFSHEHRLAKWVVHILTADIIEGRVSRTNDFRPDPKIPEAGIDDDYFLAFQCEAGNITYEGFGYDRGHLAPSADFRWSQTALSESYYYSNITPQTAEFNREKWAEIESFLRSYIHSYPDNKLYIVTAPVLRDGLPVIERGKSQLPIPEYHYKIAVDYDRQIGIAFLVPQKNLIYPIEWYAVSIDSIERLTGINYFSNMTENEQELILSQFDISDWDPDGNLLGSSPLKPHQLPRGTVNTVDARSHVGRSRNIEVCGKVVSTHKSQNGHVFLNLDKEFPNQIFSVTIWEGDVLNFDYEPEVFFKNRLACFTGRVTERQNVPGMIIQTPRRIKFME